VNETEDAGGVEVPEGEFEAVRALRFKVGDVVADSKGEIGEIVKVSTINDRFPFPYQIREANGIIGSYREFPDMRLVQTRDAVERPQHYTSHPSGIECIQITEHMGFNLGNAIKYVWRADLKNDALEDLRKAEWYIRREIQKRERK